MLLLQSQEATINEFRSLREELGISYQQITDRTEANGESVSLSTVKRVFSPESETYRFRPETLNAIAKVLFTEKLQRDQNTSSELASHEADALNSLISYNKLTIEALECENQRLKEESDRKHDHIVTLAKQGDKTNLILETLAKQSKKKDRWILVLSITVFLLLAAIIAALVIDRLNPDLGYFWLNMSALISGGVDDVSGQGAAAGAQMLLRFLV